LPGANLDSTDGLTLNFSNDNEPANQREISGSIRVLKDYLLSQRLVMLDASEQ
jgi:hypothetical protein